MRAHARPSRIRYFARVLNSEGISLRVIESTQLHNLPVGPSGSVGWREVVGVVMIEGGVVQRFDATINIRNRFSSSDFVWRVGWAH